LPRRREVEIDGDPATGAPLVSSREHAPPGSPSSFVRLLRHLERLHALTGEKRLLAVVCRAVLGYGVADPFAPTVVGNRNCAKSSRVTRLASELARLAKMTAELMNWGEEPAPELARASVRHDETLQRKRA
jgi:hypothetical protein